MLICLNYFSGTLQIFYWATMFPRHLCLIRVEDDNFGFNFELAINFTCKLKARLFIIFDTTLNMNK